MKILSFIPFPTRLTASLVMAVLTAPWCAAADQLSPQEAAKQYARMSQIRLYRNGAAVLDHVMRFSQLDEDRLTPMDRFLRAFYEGRWDEVRSTLEKLPPDMAESIYDKMLDDLTSRFVPVL